MRRVLSIRELNRALLARQLLLERSRLPLIRALEHIGGLQSQYAPSAYTGLWSRLHDFRRETLRKALERRYEKGRVRLEPFRRLSRPTRRELEEEAERLAAFHGDESQVRKS